MKGPDPVSFLVLALRDPRQGLAHLRSLGLNRGERLALIVLAAVLNVLAAEAFLAGMPEARDQGLALMLDQPLAFAALQVASLLLMSGLIHYIGRAFGGQGDGAGAQEAVILLQGLLLLFQVAQVLALTLLPVLVPMIGLASIGAALWVLPHLVAGLHGFRSVGLTFLGIVLSVGFLILLLSLFLAFVLGIEAPDV